MKIRLAKKIMKQARHLSTASDYWYRRLRDFEYKICYGFVGKKDHRITKAISLTKKKQRMTQEDFDKTRWSPYRSYRMETDQFKVTFISTCNCIPEITRIIKSKVRNGKSLWRSEVVRYVCNGIYYKNKKDFLDRCHEVFQFY